MRKIDFRNWKNFVLICIVIGLVFLALSGYVSKAVDRFTDPLIKLQSWFTIRFETIYDLFIDRTEEVQLRSENLELQKQVSELQVQIIQLEQDLDEADILYALLGFARGRPDETYIHASVIGKDPSPFLKYILIDKGSDDGLLYSMPVVTEKGLVGRISAVTASAARVQLVTDSSSMVNVKIEGPDDIDGVAVGSITGDLTIEMVSQDAQLNTGDLVLTSGLGGSYPGDIVVGQILNINQSINELFQSASLQPVEDYEQLKAVLVVANFRPSNTEPLE